MKTWSREINDQEIPTRPITGLQAIAIGIGSYLGRGIGSSESASWADHRNTIRSGQRLT